MNSRTPLLTCSAKVSGPLFPCSMFLIMVARRLPPRGTTGQQEFILGDLRAEAYAAFEHFCCAQHCMRTQYARMRVGMNALSRCIQICICMDKCVVSYEYTCQCTKGSACVCMHMRLPLCLHLLTCMRTCLACVQGCGESHMHILNAVDVCKL